MKRVTVSQARKHWFRLLDEVLDGEIVVMERRGGRILLRRDPSLATDIRRRLPDYRKVLQVHDVDHADQWHWDWSPDAADPTVGSPKEP